MIHHRTAVVGGHRVFYREAGDPAHATLLLLHGFPTSSHMFRGLIPLLANRFHLVAPDLPGFGFTTSPARGEFAYTFANLAKVVEGFTDAIGLQRYALYVFDYGAPTGFRLALARPERVTAIISQNGNAYEAGLSKDWGRSSGTGGSRPRRTGRRSAPCRRPRRRSGSTSTALRTSRWSRRSLTRSTRR